MARSQLPASKPFLQRWHRLSIVISYEYFTKIKALNSLPLEGES